MIGLLIGLVTGTLSCYFCYKEGRNQGWSRGYDAAMSQLIDDSHEEEPDDNVPPQD